MTRPDKRDPFMLLLYQYRAKLTRQQFQTLRGLIQACDEDGAMKGLAKIIRRATR